MKNRSFFHTPNSLRTVQLPVLIRITEKASGRKCSVRTLAGYRDFTARAIAEADTEALRVMRREMFRRAYRVGRLLSLIPGFRSGERRKRLISYLYKVIEIDLHDAENEGQKADAGWEICISRCFFSSAYTPKTCYVMSGLDAGIICGVFGGGKLAFRSRITEGCGCCRASWVE